MTGDEFRITVDLPDAGMLRLTLEGAGHASDIMNVPYQGPVDNLLLTAIDNLLKRNRVHKFALKAVRLGQGIDKNSSLYRIVQSFATAVAAAEKRPY